MHLYCIIKGVTFSKTIFGEVKGWILRKEELQKLGNLHQCILIEGPLQYLNYHCNLCFFTTEGEFIQSQHISYFCWVPSGGFSVLVPAGCTGKKVIHLIIPYHAKQALFIKGGLKEAKIQYCLGFS